MVLNKKASLPVTMLVILTLVIYIFALVIFSVSYNRAKGEIVGYGKVQEFNIIEKSNLFSNKKEVHISDEFSGKRYILFGERDLKIRVEKLP